MIRFLARLLTPVLQFPYIRKTRRNHGLEHATIHVLSGRIKKLSIAGRSNARGFVLIGDVPTDQVEQAAAAALKRMKAGEHDLAVHPNCGTNLVTTSFSTSLVAMMGFSNLGAKETRFNRLPLVMAGVIFTLIFSQPVGMALQRHITTYGDPGDMEIVSVSRREVRLPFAHSAMILHQVRTQGG